MTDKFANVASGDLKLRKVSSAYLQVAGQLRDLIMRGKVMPGEKLPSEAELGAAFGVSRSTLREALRVLASQHLIYTRRGVSGGTFVSEPKFELLDEIVEANLGLMAAADLITVAHLMEARVMVEVPAAGIAATRRVPAEMEAVRMALEAEAEGIETGDVLAHRGFHRELLAATGNPLLQIMCNPYSTALRNRMDRDAVPRSHWQSVLTEHRAIYEATIAGDAAEAQRLMTEHLEALGRLYQRIDRNARSASKRKLANA